MTAESVFQAINRSFESSLHPNLELKVRIERLNDIIRFLVNFLTEEENLFFPSYFSQVSYVLNKYGLAKSDIYLIHEFRRLFPLNKESVHIDSFELGFFGLFQIIKKAFKKELSRPPVDELVNKKISSRPSIKKGTFLPQLTCYISDYEPKDMVFNAFGQDERQLNIQIKDKDLNSDMKMYFDYLDKHHLTPIKVSLFNVEIKNGIYMPTYYVVQPDFLIDVTSVSNAFEAQSISIAGYSLTKLISKPQSIHITLGNIVNQVLDELVYNPSMEFDDFIHSVFGEDPLVFLDMSNDELKGLLEKLNDHFHNIKTVVNQNFKNLNIHGQNAIVEPSYFAPLVGLQGRMDLIQQQGDQVNIVELKSGKPFRPNTYGLNSSHYIQTLLYDLILSTNVYSKYQRNNFVLYSSQHENTLRYAPTIKANQIEALQVRNRLYIEECIMQNSSTASPFLYNYLYKYKGKLKGFKKTSFDKLYEVYHSLNQREKSYYEESLAFISREVSMSKMGDYQSHGNGFSSIWQLSDEEKYERFLILDYLLIDENRSEDKDSIIRLAFSEKSHRLSKFKVGDIVIFYPKGAIKNAKVVGQIYRANIIELTDQGLTIRLRSRQMNQSSFTQNKYWTIENDTLDSSFLKQYREVYTWASSPYDKRSLLLGERPPSQPIDFSIDACDSCTDHQNTIIQHAIKAEEYYLIWGPPGSGKTTVIIREVLKYYIQQTRTRILLMAYTNRAVDELCKVLRDLSPDLDYIRIGSRYSASEEWKSHLLSERYKSMTSRSELKKMLDSHRIFVGTVASISGKQSLLSYLNFGLSIIDEASQILETSIIGLLSKVKKNILIGDHRQLPAIVLQSQNAASINNKLLNDVKLSSFSNSYFERIYRHSQERKWYWAFGQLKEQGRMHEKIMYHVSENYYKNTLETLSGLTRLTSTRIYENTQSENILENERMIFIDSAIEIHSGLRKVSFFQCQIIKHVLKEIKSIFDKNELRINAETIGIITPFRAQIILIRNEITSLGKWTEHITIDTVERYQGSSRDIVIFSTVVHDYIQLQGIVSYDSEGVDRKLNVSLSRAKEQLIVIGRKNVLMESRFYSSYIENAKELKMKLLDNEMNSCDISDEQNNI